MLFKVPSGNVNPSAKSNNLKKAYKLKNIQFYYCGTTQLETWHLVNLSQSGTNIILFLVIIIIFYENITY